MRIGIVSTMGGVPWGGSEELWASTAREARKAEHAVHTWLWRNKEARPQAESLKELGVDVSQYASPASWIERRRATFAVRHPGLCRRFPRIFDGFSSLFRWKPDVVFLSLGDTYVLGLHRAYHRLIDELIARSIPYVVVVQLSVDDWMPDASAAAVTRRALEHAHFVGFVSEHNRELIRKQLGYSLPHSLVVRNPVNMEDVSSVAFPVGDHPVWACVGRFQLAHKGQDLLLNALAQPSWRSRNWSLRFYGTGPDEELVRQLVAHHGLKDRVEFLGHMKDIRALWSSNQMLVMPSLMEGTPLAMVEAMLCGRPVVGTKVGGIPEWVEEGKSGFIAETPTVEAVEATLDRAWEARESWELMGEAAHDRAKALYDPNPGGTMLRILCDAADVRGGS